MGWVSQPDVQCRQQIYLIVRQFHTHQIHKTIKPFDCYVNGVTHANGCWWQVNLSTVDEKLYSEFTTMPKLKQSKIFWRGLHISMYCLMKIFFSRFTSALAFVVCKWNFNCWDKTFKKSTKFVRHCGSNLLL